MNTTKDLLDVLNNNTTPVENRLQTALSSFTSINLNLLKNRETVLTWLKNELLKENKSTDERKLFCSVLKHCITNVTDLLLCPSLAEHMFDVIMLCKYLHSDILECIDSILNNVHFLKYFIYHVQKLADIITSMVNRLNSDHMNNDRKTAFYYTISNSILYVKNNSLQTNDLKLVFVESLIETLSLLSMEVKKSGLNESSVSSFENVFYEVLFSDTEFRQSFSQNIFINSNVDNSNTEKLAIDVVRIIKNFPTYFKPDVLASAYSLILSGFLRSNASYNAKFRIFVGLNCFVYLCPVNIDEQNPKCVMLNENINTVNFLIELLAKFDLPLDAKTQLITLMDWLKALIDVILEEIRNNFVPAVLLLLKNALSFSPALMEHCLRKFTKNVMLSKKTDQEVIGSYSDLCLYVLNVHVKLNRMHKLISALLMTLKENLNEFPTENVPSKFDVLPLDIFDRIQSAVTNLPSTVQNVALLNTLLYHLEKDCIAVLEEELSKQIDIRLQLIFDIVTYLITRFVNGTRIMDHSVPEIVKDKFILLMDNLGTLLGRFGKAVISKEHVPEFVECFLHTCLMWGDMQMVFMVYESAPRKVPKQVGIVGRSATNLVYLHPYLSDYHWSLIAQRVANFGNENCINLMSDLVLQKIHALPYLEDEIQGPYEENVNGDGPAIECANYLSSQVNIMWIFRHVPDFVHLLKPVDVLKLAKSLMSYCQACSDDEVSQIFSTDFRELRSLVLAMLCYVFHSLSKKLAKCNLKELKRILHRLDYEDMIVAETEKDNQIVDSLKVKFNEISTLVSSDFQFTDGEVDVESIQKDIHILLHLPARYLHDENKAVVCLLTLSLIKNLIKLQINNHSAIFTDLLKFLQGVLIDLELPETLDCGKILAWFHRGLRNVPYCDLTMRRLCEASKNFGSGVDSVIDIVEAAGSKDSSCDNVFIESRSDGVDLLTTYLINFEKTRKRKNSNNDGGEIKEKLKKLCYKNFDEIFHSISTADSQHHEKRLALYTLLLHEALKLREEEQLNLLSVYLPDFISFIENNTDTPSETVTRFLLVVLKYRRGLKSSLPIDFLLSIWYSHWPVAEDIVISALLKTANVDEYKEMIQLVLANMEGSLHMAEEDQLNLLYHRWKIIMETPVKEVKITYKKNIILKLCELARRCLITSSVAEESASSAVTIRKFFIAIFTSVLQTKQVALRYQVIDLCFDLITFPLCSVSADSNDLLVDCTEMLFVFCITRAPLLLDRIPSFYLCYKSLFNRLVRRTRTCASSNEEIDSLCSAAHKLEKLTDTLLKYRKDFVKTAISAVGDLVSIVAEENVETRVENHLKNIIYCWIGMCDSHGLQYLSSALPPVSQNLFKQFWSDYNKYYKFTGKV